VNDEHAPLFSVIVPIYNAAGSLKKCIDSIKDQTYHELEIILINDGSTDGSLAICNGFKADDNRIIIADQVNSGTSAAKNKGIDSSHGDYVMFIDADDYVERDAVERLYKVLADSGSDMVIFGYNRYDIIKGSEQITEVSFENKVYTGRIDAPDFVKLYKMPMLNQNWNKVYDLHMIKSSGIYFRDEMSLGEDLLFNLDVLKNCKKISIIKDILYNFMCYNPGSLSKRYRDDFFEIQQMLFHKIKGFMLDSYDDGLMRGSTDELEDQYLQTVISYISKISGYRNNSFIEKYRKISKIVSDKEIQEIAADVKTGSIKKRLLIYLIRIRFIAALILILEW
jgi:glycosyltransferase involved in cell wall biosynthesis